MQKPKTIKRYMLRFMVAKYGPNFYEHMGYTNIYVTAKSFKGSGYKFPILKGWIEQIIREHKLEDLLDE